MIEFYRGEVICIFSLMGEYEGTVTVEPVTGNAPPEYSSGYGLQSTDLLSASCNPWNLPRAKKCPPDTFCTSVRTGAVLSIPPSPFKKRNDRLIGGHFFFGGAEGNRTPVRKQLGKNFSGRSLLFTFPQPIGNKHPMGISSFMMHGMGKAYHTHVLHSNHTRARLVDLPGRMGA